MAVFHYCAHVNRDGRTDQMDGLVCNDADMYDMEDPGWLASLRKSIADLFVPSADTHQVQITSLTRIGG